MAQFCHYHSRLRRHLAPLKVYLDNISWKQLEHSFLCKSSFGVALGPELLPTPNWCFATSLVKVGLPHFTMVIHILLEQSSILQDAILFLGFIDKILALHFNVVFKSFNTVPKKPWEVNRCRWGLLLLHNFDGLAEIWFMHFEKIIHWHEQAVNF